MIGGRDKGQTKEKRKKSVVWWDLGVSVGFSIVLFLIMYTGVMAHDFMYTRPRPGIWEVIFRCRPETAIYVILSLFTGFLLFIFKIGRRDRDTDPSPDGATQVNIAITVQGVEIASQGNTINVIRWDLIVKIISEDDPRYLSRYIDELERVKKETRAFRRAARKFVPRSGSGRLLKGNGGVRLTLRRPVTGLGLLGGGRAKDIVFPSDYFLPGRYSKEEFLKQCLHQRTNYYLKNRR